MKAGFILLAACSIAATPALAEGPAPGEPWAPVMHGPPATAAAILAAEHAFERRSVSAGAAAAYGDFVDPADGLAFPGGAPIRGAQAIADVQGKQLGGGMLDWRPEEIFASTGDMGAVWGRWSFTAKALPKPITGRYITVWRQTPGGAWKALMDIGNPDP